MSPEDVRRLLLSFPWDHPWAGDRSSDLEVALEDATYPPLPSGSYRPRDSLPRYSRPPEPSGSRTVRVHTTRPSLPDPRGVHPSDMSFVWLPYVPRTGSL